MITVHGALDAATRCLEAVAATTDKSTRVVVVLDACDAATTTALKAWPQKSARRRDVVIETDFRSYTKAVNAGLEVALAAEDRLDLWRVRYLSFPDGSQLAADLSSAAAAGYADWGERRDTEGRDARSRAPPGREHHVGGLRRDEIIGTLG